MAMTEFTDLQQSLADRLGEDSTSYPDNLVYYSQTELKYYINRAYNDFLKRTQIYIETKTDLSADANGYYTIAEDVNNIISIYYQGKDLKVATNKELNDKLGASWRDIECNDSELPEYVVWENNYTARSSQDMAFTIAKKPTTYEDIEINYIPYIELSSSDDTMLIPIGAEDTVLLYAEALAYKKDGIDYDLQFSAMRQQEYLEEVQMYISRYYTNQKLLPLGNKLGQQIQQGGNE